MEKLEMDDGDLVVREGATGEMVNTAPDQKRDRWQLAWGESLTVTE